MAKLRQARNIYEPTAFAMLSESPRETSPYAVYLDPAYEAEKGNDNTVSAVGSVAGAVVDGVGTVGTFLRSKAKGTIRGTMLDWGSWKGN